MTSTHPTPDTAIIDKLDFKPCCRVSESFEAPVCGQEATWLAVKPCKHQVFNCDRHYSEANIKGWTRYCTECSKSYRTSRTKWYRI